MRLRRVFLSIFALSLAGAAISATATAAPLALHLKWRVIAPSADQLFGAGPYVGYYDDATRGYPPFVLIDDETGERTLVPAPGCGGVAMSATWIAFDCYIPKAYDGANRQFRFYNIGTGRWKRDRCGALCAEWGDLEVDAVGSRWLLLDIPPHRSCGDGVHYICGPYTYYVMNIATGEIRRAPDSTGATTEDSLDSPTLQRPICPPLEPGPGSWSSPPVTFFHGPYAIVNGADGPYLGRCGSPLHMPLASGDETTQLGNREAAVSLPLIGPSEGIFVPSLRHFTFHIPTGWLNAVLGPRHLYMIGGRLNLRVAAFPAGPRAAGFGSR